MRPVLLLSCGCLGLVLLLAFTGCKNDRIDSVFSEPIDLGSGDRSSFVIGIGGSANNILYIPTRISPNSGFAASARVRLAETTAPYQFSEHRFDRGPDAKILDYWVDGSGDHSLLIQHRDPDTQRQWIMLERIARHANEGREYLLARDKWVYWKKPVHSPAGEEFLLLKGEFLSEFKEELALLPITDSQTAATGPKILPFPGDSTLWIRHFGFSPAGDMFLIWSHGVIFSGGAAWVKETLIAHSEDNGVSWSEPLIMPDLPKENSPMAYRLSHAESGVMHLFIATQSYENADGSAAKYIMKNLLHLSSADKGKTWQEIAVTLPIAPAGAVYRGIAVDAGGIINIIWSTDRTVYLIRSFDRGATWTPWMPLTIPGDWLLTDCEMVLSEDGNIQLCIRACHPGSDDIYSRPKNILFSHTDFANN